MLSTELFPVPISSFFIPTIVKTNTASLLGTKIEYFPSISVVVPVVVPLTITVTPISFSPFSEEDTTPVIVFV